MDSNNYSLNAIESMLIWKSKLPTDSIELSYHVFPIKFNEVYQKKSTDLIQTELEYLENPFRYRPVESGRNLFEFGGLNKSGSISRGIGFGNNQDLTVNSTLSLQLSGNLTDEIKVLASVTDDNIPIQPDGNTAQLQEFDQVYIQLYDDKNKLIAGDFILERPVGYFMNYYKRAQGASFTTTRNIASKRNAAGDSLRARTYFGQASAAISKGKFARNIIDGIEGNQGPYRLRGNENEAFIIVLAGTEKVFIDGRRLQRGQENDYIIDYNTAEIVFTANQLITKDKRIVVEFQYTDIDYSRSLVQASTGLANEKFEFYINLYSEQDAKNQPLQQDLSDFDRQILSEAGDEPQNAIVSSIDSVAFTNDQVLYSKVDSLGYDSVFVHSTQSDEAFYRLSFSNVGFGNGDYIQDSFTASGKIYRWIAPDTINGTIVRQGQFEPVRQLTAPKLSQLAIIGGKYQIAENTELNIETGLSNFDKNTFSELDEEDNTSFSGMINLQNISTLQKERPKPLKIKSSLMIESLGSNFEYIEPYRDVEFNRNWNLNDPTLNTKKQILSRAGLQLEKGPELNAGYSLNSFSVGDHYKGLKNEVNALANYNSFDLSFNGSFLTTTGDLKSRFMRHRSKVEKNVLFTRIGFEDEREDNQRFLNNSDSLATSSYKFYDWQVYFTNQDTAKILYKIFYRERDDLIVEEENFSRATNAQHYGIDLQLLENVNNQIKISLSQRELRIVNEELTDITPEKTLLGRLDHNLRLFKGAVTTSTFYEIGSGLEREREYIYVFDPTGQALYTWIDYNGDDKKDLNEFEIARPEDGDRYLRIYTPTDNYIKAYSNQFSESLFLNPAVIWSNKVGLLKFLSRFSDQTSYRIERKTLSGKTADRYNPFEVINDSILISQSSSLRNTLFFNRSNTSYGVDYTIASQRSKTPLTDGFEERRTDFHSVRIRWNLSNAYALIMENELGERASSSNFIEGRNFMIDYYKLKQTFSYQPGTSFRLSISSEYTHKQNAEDLGNEQASILDLGLENRINKAESGSILLNFNVINIKYNGESNNTLAYEMLNGLQTGTNFTWAAGIQRNLGNNLQLNLSYNGRKSEEVKAVHTGNVQVRAFF